MAQSRLEKVASIFTRVSQLHRAQNLPEQDLPLWYNIYKTFPPKYDPKYNRKYESKPVKQIFYEEDIPRSRFHQECPESVNCSLLPRQTSQTREFLDIYDRIKEEEKDLPSNELFMYAVNEFKRTRSSLQKNSKKLNVDISKIFNTFE